MVYPNQFRTPSFTISKVLFEAVCIAKSERRIREQNRSKPLVETVTVPSVKGRTSTSFADFVSDVLSCGSDRDAVTMTLSTLDHHLGKASTAERQKFFEEKPDNFDDLITEDQAYFASYAEALSELVGAVPPAWCFDPKYSISNPRESLQVKHLLTVWPTFDVDAALERALPAFRKRGGLNPQILSSF